MEWAIQADYPVCLTAIKMDMTIVSQNCNSVCSTDVFDKVVEIARASGRAPGDCVKCANDILKVFQQAGVEARKVELRSDWDLILHNSSDQPITQIGRHFAVESHGKIYDAFHPEGIAKGEYIKQFEIL